MTKPFTIHSKSWMQTDFTPTPEEQVARRIGCADDDDTEKTSILPWVLAACGLVICVLCGVFA